jgi:hypothetical protein
MGTILDNEVAAATSARHFGGRKPNHEDLMRLVVEELVESIMRRPEEDFAVGMMVVLLELAKGSKDIYCRTREVWKKSTVTIVIPA